MNKKFTLIKEKYNMNKRELWFCIIASFVLGLLAHGYMFFNNSISHDSLSAFLLKSNVTDNKVELGRLFVPFYRTYIGGIITAPWLMGIISLLCIGLATFFIVKIFDVKSNLYIGLIAGILTINKTTISLFGTYIHDADCDMLAMLCAVLSVYLLLNYKKGYLVGAVLLLITLGFYQSYISVAITLIIMVCILKLLDGDKLKDTMCLLCKGICMVVIAGIVYFVILKTALFITGIEVVNDKYNSLATVFTMSFKDIVHAAISTYITVVFSIVRPFSYNTAVTDIISVILYTLMLFVPAVIVIRKIFAKEIKAKELCLIIILAAALPLAMNISRTLAGNMSHDLMHYAIWISYVFAIAILSAYSVKIKVKQLYCNVSKTIVVSAIIVVLFLNVRTANQLYVVKDFAYDSNLSLMTRVLDRLEQDENYIPGETSVAFIGSPDYLVNIQEHKVIPPITGFDKSTSVLGAAESVYYESYFKNVLNSPVSVVEKKETKELMKDERIQDMPTFPAEGSMEIVDGIYVVKMGNYEIK